MRKTVDIQKVVDVIARFQVDSILDREKYPMIADSSERISRELKNSLIQVLYMTETAKDYEAAEAFTRNAVEKKRNEIYQQKLASKNY